MAGDDIYENYYDNIPCNYGNRLNSFEKLLLIKIFRPEKIAESLSIYLERELGTEFATSPVSSIENLF
jgi:hypothetical protein